MTQDVQPLTYQHRTNIEEHRQFFSKINEIIDNLAPTVAEAEAATAQANSAIATANAASANANSAVDTANAASASAQASATTVSGYAARLAAIEASYIKDVSSEVQTIDSDLQVTNGHDLAVAGDVNVAGGVNASGQSEIAGMAIEKSGNVTVLSNDNGINTSSPITMGTLNVTGTATIAAVPTSTTGARNTAPVNGTRLQNDLDAYTPMLRTSGNQNISGIKTTTSNLIGNYYGASPISNSSGLIISERDTSQDVVANPSINRYFPPILFEDGNKHRVGGVRVVHNPNGTCSLVVGLRNSDGTYKNIVLATSDVIA